VALTRLLHGSTFTALPGPDYSLFPARNGPTSVYTLGSTIPTADVETLGRDSISASRGALASATAIRCRSELRRLHHNVAMLAKLYVFLPFELTIPEDAKYQLYGFESCGYQVQFDVPARSDRSPAGGRAMQVTINDKPAIQADALAITFKKESFNRSISSTIDPPVELINSVLDFFLGRIRYVTNAQQIKSVEFPKCQWALEYRNDDESELELNLEMLRRRMSHNFSISLASCDPDIWNYIFSLPIDFQPPTWHTLLLDSQAALPHVGTAVVLAATALEVFIAELLNALVKKSHAPNDLWDWINDRDNDFNKQPSVAEQFDTLLRVMTGHSLKEEDTLWQGFQKLKNARNKFVHVGVPRIGKSAPLTETEALSLIGQAAAIVAKIREWIPEENRWPVYVGTSKLEALVSLVPQAKAENPPPVSQSTRDR
jgi:hypothetical protein